MTSMRMQILSCVSLVDLVLVCSGAVHWWGGGRVMTSMRMVAFLLLFCVLCIGGDGGGTGAFRTGCCGVFLKFAGSGQQCADPRLVAHASLDFQCVCI